MIDAGPAGAAEGRDRLTAILGDVRPELFRYCARLTGSTFDGEEVVQDVLVRALGAVDGLSADTRLRPWLFRVAHNRAIDYLRSQGVRRAEPLEAAAHVADGGTADPDEALARREAVAAAVSRFIDLPVSQRSAVILKDVLGHSLKEVGDLLGLDTNAVKAVLSRGRDSLRRANAAASRRPRRRPPSAAAARFADLFNRRDWDALRALLAEEVHLSQATRAERHRRADVGRFFSIYAEVPVVRLVPARLDGGDGPEVLAVFAGSPEAPAYLMQVTWDGARVRHIRDFRYATYILDGADVVLADGAPRD